MPVKTSGLPEDTAPTIDDFIPALDTGSATLKKVKIQNLIAIVAATLYPVGTIYSEMTGTNPATKFGIGTWVQIGQGQTLVGQQTADTDFATAGNTGGEKTHVLSWNEMPVHNHGVNDPGHDHKSTNGSDTMFRAPGSTNYTSSQSNYTPISWGAARTDGNSTGISIQNAGSGSAANNMQPYVVVYFWQRTA